MTGLVQNRITMFTSDFSGSNTVAFYKFLRERKTFLEPMLVMVDKKVSTAEIEHIQTSKFLMYKSIYPVRYSEGQIVIQTWHGFPLKTLGVMSENDCLRDKGSYVEQMVRADIILSYSTTYQTLYNACFPTKASKYYVTGMPRNDFLFIPKEKALENLKKVLNVSKGTEKFILFMPTYRLSGHCKDDYDENAYLNFITQILNVKFISFLSSINARLFLKLHPLEEHFLHSLGFIDSIEKVSIDSSRIILIKDHDFMNNFIDFYEVLQAFDLLITDYSSIAYDWLLMDKPIVHFIPDEDMYRKKRNFLADPVELWLPGPICRTTDQLQREIEISLGDSNYFSEKRERIKRIVHKFADGNSSQRVYSLLKAIYDQIV